MDNIKNNFRDNIRDNIMYNFKDNFRRNFRDNRDNFRDNFNDNFRNNFRDNIKDNFRNNFGDNFRLWGVSIMLPGTPDLDRGPGGSPKTFSDPESTFSLPTMHFSKVVFPQPDGPTKKNTLVLFKP